MATLREVRNRIAGVKKTQKITKAMKMVAAAKLRRAQNGVVGARPYAQNLNQLLRHLLRNVEPGSYPLTTAREPANVAIMVVTSDRGLCGAFNSNIVRATLNHIQRNFPGASDGERLTLFCAGKKGFDYFSKRHYNVAGKYIGVYNDLAFHQAQTIAREVIESFLKGEVDVVEIVYNEFKSIARQNIVVERFLPVSAGPAEDGKNGGNGRVDYIYEPSATEIVKALLPRLLTFHVWKALLESNAAEQGARMAAMENATENANEMISHLQLVYNKARQAAITKELLELVGGAEALKKSA